MGVRTLGTNWRRATGRVVKRVATKVLADVATAKYQGAIRTLTQSRGGSSSGVTTQHDVKNQYRRKTMPARKRKRWVRFVKKVHAAEDNRFGTRSIVRNLLLSGTLLSANSQTMTSFGLYTCGDTFAPATGGSVDLWRDVVNIASALGYSDPSSSPAAGVERGQENLRFTAGVLDFTFKNSSASVGLEVDMYIMRPRSNARWSASSTPETLMNDGWNQTGSTSLATTLTSSSRGVTPFQSTALCRKFKIYKKTKYLVGAGQTFTFQYRDPRNYQYNLNKLTNGGASYYGLGRKCYVVLLVIKRLVGDVGDVTYNIGVTRTYTLKKVGDNDFDAIV